MGFSEIDQGVREILALVLKRPVPPGIDVARADEPKWDSLQHVSVIFALEERFEMVFSEEQMAGLDSISTIVRHISAHHAA